MSARFCARCPKVLAELAVVRVCATVTFKAIKAIALAGFLLAACPAMADVLTGKVVAKRDRYQRLVGDVMVGASDCLPAACLKRM